MLTLVLCARFFDANDPAQSAGLYDDFKVLLNLLPGKEGTRADVQASLLRFQSTLASKGYDVVYLDNAFDSDYAQALLMYWKLPDGEYNVIYRDLRMVKVDDEQLIKLQSDMIRHQRD